MSCIRLEINSVVWMPTELCPKHQVSDALSTELGGELFSDFSKNISLPFLGLEPTIFKSQDHFSDLQAAATLS